MISRKICVWDSIIVSVDGTGLLLLSFFLSPLPPLKLWFDSLRGSLYVVFLCFRGGLRSLGDVVGVYMVLFEQEMGFFSIISLEIGGNIPRSVLGDYRGNL